MKKRIIIASVFGLLFGIVCCTLASSHGTLPMVIMLSIVTGRTMIGFVIGVSNLKMHWAWHGLLIGTLVSIPAGLGAMMAAKALMSANAMFLSTVGVGAVYGLLIEFFTTIVFKAER